MRRWLSIARHYPIMSLGFAIALAALVFFTVTFVQHTVYWMDPAHQTQPLEEWMTPRYIANSWGIDGPDLAKHLGITARPKERPTLRDIAAQQDVPVGQILAIVEAYLAEHAKPQ